MNEFDGKAQALAEKAYYGKYPITNPAYNVMRIAGRQIRMQAKRHFSGSLLEIDAVSGATISSRGVCTAVTEAFEFYRENKEEILASVADRG